MKNILVTGGCGYIGSAMAKELKNKKFNVFIIDDLSKGEKKYIDKSIKFSKIDLCDNKKLEKFFSKNSIDCVIHCAGKKAVGESEENPGKYLTNNISGLINVLNSMIKFNVKKIIFSSSACVYAPSKTGIFKETDSLSSPNIYGYTKLQNEEMIKEISRTKNIDYTIFRYFNVAGDVGIKYQEKEAQNIFPVLCEAIKGIRKEFLIFGNKYDTKDGTGVRDYIHLEDLVKAHIKAINYKKNEIFNLGTKKGTSVLQIVKEFEKQLNKKVNYKFVKNRKGDVGTCLANSEKAKKLLNWESKKDLKEIVKNFIKSYDLK
jgi:UDP-glucose 4-epimerase